MLATNRPPIRTRASNEGIDVAGTTAVDLERGEDASPPPRLRCGRFPNATEQVLTGGFYVLGGLLFTIGSFVFWPQLQYPPGAGTLIFRWGSLSYISGSVYGIIQLLWPPFVNSHTSHDTIACGAVNPLGRTACLWIVVKVLFVIGSCAFLLGGVLFLGGDTLSGSWVWVLGSSLFISGSFLSLYGIQRVDRI
jgi:hypothetical protein